MCVTVDSVWSKNNKCIEENNNNYNRRFLEGDYVWLGRALLGEKTTWTNGLSISVIPGSDKINQIPDHYNKANSVSFLIWVIIVLIACVQLLINYSLISFFGVA